MARHLFLIAHLYKELPEGEQEIREHVRALAFIAEAPEHQQELFDHLYNCLSILDAKASALLTFDSIIIAIFVLFLTQGDSSVEWYIANLGMLAILSSAYALLSVVWVHWSTTGHLGSYDNHAAALLEVRKTRTIRYRLAWDLALIATLLLLAVVVAKFIAKAFAQ